ncbi:transposase [Deinococcus ruber]|uniref:transposase n=1 Tax=Deinococcus ruber TaxID=1848197 RepID=UPI0027E403D0|nr:transposase [Deinococcus ruber]
MVTLSQQRSNLLNQQLVALETALHALVDADPPLTQQRQLLCSVPGFAFTSALTILTETAGFHRLETGAEISAAAGMDPSPHQSGA